MKCDHCKQDLHRDTNGWFVGSDDTSDCPDSGFGHMVDGQPR